MKGESEERSTKRRKKKRKFGYYLYAVVVLLLTITNITLATWLLTYVQSIHVVGNVNSGKQEIIDWVKEDPMTVNSLYTLWKFKSGAYKLPVYLEDVEVSLKAPWKVQVDVKEKQVIGCVLDGKACVYFDSEGLVLKKATQYEEGIPLIEGIQVEQTGLFEYLKVDNEKVFSYIVNITDGIGKNELSPDRIVWEDDSMNLYFETICVKLGKSSFEDKLIQLPPLLENLEGKTGILDLEHYTKGSTISFEENTEES